MRDVITIQHSNFLPEIHLDLQVYNFTKKEKQVPNSTPHCSAKTTVDYLNSRGLYLATKETLTVYGQHNKSATNVLSVTDNRKMNDFLNKCSPCLLLLRSQTPSIRCTVCPLTSFYQSWLSLIKPVSIHVPMHWVRLSLGFRLFKRPAERGTITTVTTAAAAAITVKSSPWESQFKTNY